MTVNKPPQLQRSSRSEGVLIGTAGWSIPGIHRASFPEHGSHLERYAQVFSVVEINSSFYRPHRKTTYERWASATPMHFCFSVKAPKSITHEVAQAQSKDADAFFAEISGLGAKLGTILIQLPPKREFAKADVIRLISTFREQTDGAISLEPRHASWFAPAADDVLSALRIARVAADPPRGPSAENPGGWGGLTYHRLHGSPQIYRSSYSDVELRALAITLQRIFDGGSNVYQTYGVGSIRLHFEKNCLSRSQNGRF